jgi:hypothetical protein
MSDNSKLLNQKWILFEEYSDPGDGSGKWYKVSLADSKKYFKFYGHGKIEGDYFGN